MLQAHVSDHVAAIAKKQTEEQYRDQMQKMNEAMQQAQQNPQAMQQLEKQQEQLLNEAAATTAQMEAELTKQLAADEEARMSKEQQDPLIKLKQQEIDLKAMETTARLQKDMAIDSEKLDLERDKLEAGTAIDIMKASANVDEQRTSAQMSMLKESIITAREAMKDKTQERVARENVRKKNESKT